MGVGVLSGLDLLLVGEMCVLQAAFLMDVMWAGVHIPV